MEASSSALKRPDFRRALSPPSSVKVAIPPATPLGRELIKLAQEKLLTVSSKKSNLPSEKIQEINQKFSWQSARLAALFNAMYVQGVTDQDADTIKTLRGELEE